MSTDRKFSKPIFVAVMGIVVAVIISVGLALREHGPGNMGTGFLQGAAVGLALAGFGLWRATRRSESSTSFERAWLGVGDERDDALLTRALAVLGLLAFPLTAVAAIAIGLGADMWMMLALLLFAQIGVGVVSYAVIARRS